MKRAAKFERGGIVTLTEEQLRRRRDRERAAQEFIDNLRRLSGSGNERIPYGLGSRRPPVAPPAATENQPLRSGPLTAEEEARMNEPPRPPRRTAPAMPAPAVDMQTGDVPGSRAPTPSGSAAAERMREIDMQGADVPGNRGMSPAARPRPAAAPAARPRPAQRQAPRPRYSEADIARIRSVMEGGDIQPEQPGFFERMGIRRTNETGEGAPSTGSLRGDLQALGRSLGFKKGGAIKGKGMHMMPDGSMMKNEDHTAMKKGNKAMMYREGGKVRQGMQSPKAQEARAEMAEDVMKRSMPAEPKRRMRDMMSPEEGREYDAPLTPQERERMRASGFKKGGMIKPKTAMKKGGVVKKAAGGKIAAPKKMMKGGMTSKPKKMMGGGRAMYAKGGMAKGKC